MPYQTYTTGWEIEPGHRDRSRELEGRGAAVTGAASGIGLASAEAMLTAGARVVMIGRDEAALDALRARLGKAALPLVIGLLVRRTVLRCGVDSEQGENADWPRPTSLQHHSACSRV